MRILDRYIGFTIAYSTVFVLLVLVALFTFFNFAGELNKTGRGDYDMLQAAQFVFFNIPTMLYQIFPAAALIGTMSGLGMLANNSELVAMRAAGYTLGNILRSVFIFAFVLVLIVAVVGEYLAPISRTYAEVQRNQALSGKKLLSSREGVWLRDGDKFIYIEKITDDGRLLNVNTYQLNDKQKLMELSQIANAANLNGDTWLLSDLQRFQVQGDDIAIKQYEMQKKDKFLSPQVLELVSVKPETMSALTAYEYVKYLEKNDVDARHYKQVFWMKLATPFATFVMVLLAIPIIMGSVRSMTAGHRILIGTLTGIGFYLLSQVFAYMGLVFEIAPALTAFLPVVAFSFVAFYLMKRVR
ncbi:MAG: LPS export ABC transporter permease LptG [Gammaproteobacteria bacterium]|nr:LPS export ABC transporter permease LptG [Gammaproteobacteria bacterium]